MHQVWTIRSFWGFGILLTGMGLYILIQGLFGPLNLEVPPISKKSNVSRLASPVVAVTHPLAQYAVIWQTDIRRPVDAASIPTSAAPASLNVKLLAIVMESQRPSAVFQDSQQNIAICTLGQTVEGCEVVDIQYYRVILQQQGQRFVLTIPEKEPLNGAPTQIKTMPTPEHESTVRSGGVTQ